MAAENFLNSLDSEDRRWITLWCEYSVNYCDVGWQDYKSTAPDNLQRFLRTRKKKTFFKESDVFEGLIYDCEYEQWESDLQGIKNKFGNLVK